MSEQQNCGETAKKVVGVPFQPGDDPRRNLKGRPQKRMLTEVWDEMLEENLSDPVRRQEYKDHVWAKMQSKGVVSAMFTDRVVERTEGKLTQPVDVSGTLDIGTVLEKWRNDDK